MDQPLNLQDAILNLQRYLRALSYADSRIIRPPLDGLFDTDTQQAVSSFQRIYGLADTGIVNKETWDAIYREYLLLGEQTERPPSPNFFPKYPQDYEAVSGDQGDFLYLVQILLRELSVIYDGFGEIELTGILDEATEAAIRVFQRASGLKDTGRVDLMTWNRLTRDFFNYAAF